MPTFRWIGIDLAGKKSRGQDVASSKAELANLLLSQQVGLMRAHKISDESVLGKVVLSQKINLLSDLSTLLESGVRIPQALRLLLRQTKQASIRRIVGYLSFQIDKGLVFNDALQNIKAILGNIVVAGLSAGYSSGDLVPALQQVCDYLGYQYEFQKRLRSALILPVLTLVFFVAMTLLIFIAIVPHFAAVFASADSALTSSTKFVLGVSDFLRSRNAIVALLILIIIVCGSYLISITKQGMRFWHKFVLKIPVVGGLVCYRDLVLFLQASSLLLDGGVATLPALQQAANSVNNFWLRNICQQLILQIEQGLKISEAMQKVSTRFFPENLVAMVVVGEESGRLSLLLQRGANYYQQRLLALLQTIVVFVQPTLIILLGCLVALLIFAVYVPIFNLPAAVGNNL